MDKVSIYDFIVFFVPGATFILLAFWFVQALGSPVFNADQYPKELLVIVAILPCYFIGNFLSWMGAKIEKRRDGTDKAVWVQSLESDSWLADRLNEIAQTKWSFSFKANGIIDQNLSDRFYDLAYQLLEVEGKLEKVRTLYMQYRLFCNSVPLSIAAFIMAFIIIIKNSVVLRTCECNCCTMIPSKNLAEAVFIAVASLIFCWLALHFYPVRRKLMMKALFEMFYAYSVINKK
jgi:hypothetical protein